MARIEILFNEETGAITSNSTGFEGEKCIEEVNKILGEQDMDVTKTDEFYQKRVTVNQQTQGVK